MIRVTWMHLLKPNHADVAYVKDGVSRSTCDSYDDSHFADMSVYNFAVSSL